MELNVHTFVTITDKVLFQLVYTENSISDFQFNLLLLQNNKFKLLRINVGNYVWLINLAYH